MRPYLAIIKDSFRAAMASRVLYVLLLLITVLLLALAPLHMQETLDWQLSRDFNVQNPEVVLRQIVNNKDSKPASRVWELLPERTKSKMEKTIVSADDSQGANNQSQSVEEIFLQEDMIKQLNLIIENPEFYRAEDWANSLLPTEAQEYIDNGVESLSEVRSKRLNRLLLAKAFPGIDQGNASALKFKYAIWEFPAPLSMTHEQFAQTLTSQLPWYFEKLVLSVGLLIAIIVTANMIPETFEPGSLNLLLSKPISRWGLFIAKFVGGCVFIALCAAYLFIFYVQISGRPGSPITQDLVVGVIGCLLLLEATRRALGPPLVVVASLHRAHESWPGRARSSEGHRASAGTRSCSCNSCGCTGGID